MDDLLKRFQEGMRQRGGRNGHFSPEMKATAVSYIRLRRKDGGTCKAIAKDLGISTRTLHDWSNASTVEPGSQRSSGFRAVRVVARSRPEGSVVLRGPGGWWLEGLSLDQAARLVQLLRIQS